MIQKIKTCIVQIIKYIIIFYDILQPKIVYDQYASLFDK